MKSVKPTDVSRLLHSLIDSKYEMKVLLINGSPHQVRCTYTALHEVEDMLQSNGIAIEWLYFGKQLIAGCIACGNCLKTGTCFHNDVV